MTIGDRIKKAREEKQLSTNDLSRLTGISQSTISKLENGKRKAELTILETIADALNISVDKLIGESASSIIEDRLKETGRSIKDIAETAKVPLYWLQNLDTFIPGQSGDYEIGYDWITRVADVLGLPGGKLRSALARQEIPAYDGPSSTAGEAFADISFDTLPLKHKAQNSDLTQDEILTLAAHQVGHTGELSESDLDKIKLAVKIALAKNDK